jgi:hypothetical protein
VIVRLHLIHDEFHIVDFFISRLLEDIVIDKAALPSLTLDWFILISDYYLS